MPAPSAVTRSWSVASGDLTTGGRTPADGTGDFTNYDDAHANAIPGATPGLQGPTGWP